MSNGFVEFRQGLPFYEMVSAFMVAVSSCPAIFDTSNRMGFSEGEYIVLPGILSEGKHIFPYEVFTQAQQGNISQGRFVKSCCMMLTNTAYESVKELNDKSPEFEFFRHLRNASSHQNKFSFSTREPMRESSWRGAIIEHSTKGADNPLNGQECFGAFIGMAELLDLLKDIEAKIAT
ncbi:hypothetical protein NBRC116493_13780 [Aurantivibrio infirmus]